MRYAMNVYDFENIICNNDKCYNCENYVMACYGGNPFEKCSIEVNWEYCDDYYSPIELEQYINFTQYWYKKI